MTPQEVLLTHVVPAIGVVIAIITFGSPLPAILEADKTKKLKEMNPLPFIAMAANCTLGSFYGQITRDWYLIVANGVGVCLSWMYLLTSFKFLSTRDQDRVCYVTLAATSVFLIVGAVNMPGIIDRQQLWGCTAVAILAIYYVAPLTSLVKVMSQRDSSSLYWPLCLTNLTNGLLWFVYGLARKDYFFIAMPNAMGVVFNAVSLVLCLIFPARARMAADSDSESDGSKSAATSDAQSCAATGGALQEPGLMRRLLQSFNRSSSLQQLPTATGHAHE